MLTIYGVYRSRAARTYWMAAELGLEVKSVPVIQARRLADPQAADAPINTRSPDFRAISPTGCIPAIDDNGLVLFESLAINLYLARKHGGPLAAQTLQEEARMTMWTMWAATEVEPHAVKIILTLDAGAGDSDAGRAVIGVATEALQRSFAMLDAHLEHSAYVAADRFTVADLNLAEVFRYTMSQHALFAAAPRVKTWLEHCQSRPAFKATMAIRATEPE